MIKYLLIIAILLLQYQFIDSFNIHSKYIKQYNDLHMSNQLQLSISNNIYAIKSIFQSNIYQINRLIRKVFQPRLLNDSILINTTSYVNIKAPWNAPPIIWNISWRLHMMMMPILHAFDGCSTRDTCANLAVLWWKAISGCRLGSLTFDNDISYDLLPPVLRVLVRFPFCWLYPNLHHQTVALRTLYLDNVIKNELSSNQPNDLTKVIVIGSGFDSRSLRFLQMKQYNSKWYELDLPSVIEQKKLLLSRYCERRCINECEELPILYGVDLNDIDTVNIHLNDILTNDKNFTNVIFVIEAVLLYLNQENVIPLFKSIIETSKTYTNSISICFADRLPGIVTNNKDSNFEYIDAVKLFEGLSMKLISWLPKPGKARHMGVAKYVS